MEEYLQYMKTLRSQMNDVEDQAAKVSVEEQLQLTTIQTIQTLENDLNSAVSETKRLMEEQMKNAKGQALELIDQERINLSSKLIEKSTYNIKVREDVNAKLQQQQVKDRSGEKRGHFQGKASFDNHLSMGNQGNDARKNLMNMFDSAKAKLDEILQMKFELVIENCKTKQDIEQVNLRENDFKPEVRAMDIKRLEEEFNTLLSDKAETEYLKTLQNQIVKLKGISHVLKCACGVEYKVELDICA